MQRSSTSVIIPAALCVPRVKAARSLEAVLLDMVRFEIYECTSVRKQESMLKKMDSTLVE